MNRAEVMAKLMKVRKSKSVKGRAARKADRRENEIQPGILAYLALRGDMAFFRNNTGGYSPRPGQWINYGMYGSSDVICCWSPYGRFVGIEIKRIGEEPKPHQLEWGAKLERMGGIYIVAYDVENVKTRLEREAQAMIPRVNYEP